MRYLYLLLALLPGLADCGQRDHAATATAQAAPDTLAAPIPMPATWQAGAFLDSVALLPTAPLAVRATHYVDSLFTHPAQLHRVVSSPNLKLLKQAGRDGFLDLRSAQLILGDTSLRSGLEPVDPASGREVAQTHYVSFGADEFAVCLGASGQEGAAMYFFKGNQLIAKHPATYHYGESLRHYRDAEGHTVVYYLYGFERGSGIWWNQYFFYRYEGQQLVPLLNELQNGNLRQGWGERAYWLEATVQQTNPLTLKMVYSVELPDTTGRAPFLLNDSTLVAYRWNRQTGRLQGQYPPSKITQPQVLSYYVQNNDLLFCNAYYQLLKRALTDDAQQLATRRYLWAVRQHYGRRRQ